LGQSVSIADNIENGLLFNVGLGYKLMVAPKTGMNLGLGYIRQDIHHDSPDKERYSSLGIRVGLLL